MKYKQYDNYKLGYMKCLKHEKTDIVHIFCIIHVTTDDSTLIKDDEEERAGSPSSHAEWLFGQLEASLLSGQREFKEYKSFDRSSLSDVT